MNKQADALTLFAYAKINLNLYITGVREDGYHTLSSVMQRVSLCDTLHIKKTAAGITLRCDRTDLPDGEKNLAYRAARRYLDATGAPGGVIIDLKKRIPSGAGLGGGSADAAAVLRGMEALFLRHADLPAIALTLGADVPFLLEGKTALCEGIGECVTPLAFPEKEQFFAVIAREEGDGLSTPFIYSEFDRDKRSSFPGFNPLANRLLEKKPAADLFPFLENDLSHAAINVQPSIGNLIDSLKSLGAVGAQMTGSGSAVFGLFADRIKAENALLFLQERGVFAALCTFL